MRREATKEYVVIGVAVMVLIGLLTFVSVRSIREVNNSSFAVNLRTCHRLNILRATDNRNWLAAYETSPDRVRLGLRSRSLAWVPLTNCPAAVETTRPPPQPVPYAVQLPPPSALRLGPLN